MADTKDLKKFRGGIRLDASTDTAPANAEVGAMYVDTNGTLKIYNGSAWDSVGSGAGTTNYIATAESKGDSIAGFTAYADAAAVTPVDGTAGSATAGMLTQDTSTKLRGINSVKLLKAASTAEQGMGISCDFTIDNADKAKKLLISFDYTEGTSGDYEDGNARVFIYDKDNSNLIRVNGEDIKATTGTKQFIGQFQTAADSDDYRLIIHIADAGNGATHDWELFLDNISVAPQTVTQGAMATDFTSYTPTLNSETNISAKYAQYKRVGDSIEVKFAVKYSGQGHSSGFTLSLPSGLTFDTAKMPQVAEADGVGFLGSCAWYNAGTGTSDLQVAYSSTTAIHIFGDIREIVAGHGDGSGDESTNSLQSNYLYTNDYLSGTFTAPITGWSANTQMSEDFSGRDVVFKRTHQTASTASNGVALPIPWDGTTTNIDTANGFSGTTYTIPETGYYDIVARATLQSTALIDAGESCHLLLLTDTVITEVSTSHTIEIATAESISPGVEINTMKYLTKGQTLVVQIFYGASSAATLNMRNEAPYNWFSVTKRNSAQTVLENETVAARITKNDAQAIGTGSPTIVEYDDAEFDTHGAWGSNKYTTPITGYYSVTAKIRFNDLDEQSGDNYQLSLFVNGSEKAQISDEASATNTTSRSMHISDMLSLSKGDYVEVKVFQGTGGPENTVTYIYNNVFTIAKIK